MSTHDGQPCKRGGRVVAKATPGQVTALARNLPLTHSMLGKAIENATPGQLGFLANLFEAENASRAESKRRRLPGQAGFLRARPWRDTTGGMASFPADWGREQLESLEFVDRAEGLVLYGDVGCGKTHLTIAIGVLACRRMIPVRFFTAWVISSALPPLLAVLLLPPLLPHATRAIIIEAARSSARNFFMLVNSFSLIVPLQRGPSSETIQKSGAAPGSSPFRIHSLPVIRTAA